MPSASELSVSALAKILLTTIFLNTKANNLHFYWQYLSTARALFEFGPGQRWLKTLVIVNLLALIVFMGHFAVLAYRPPTTLWEVVQQADVFQAHLGVGTAV